jgi:hypothetical protein
MKEVNFNFTASEEDTILASTPFKNVSSPNAVITIAFTLIQL